ncbi:hypothetical protein PRIPAC_79397 [Pristionchus pacificus]|uniref:Uncharacterized protein n=1 Tax=Pristionchus pacificus TaxID=54126 RepID=A0A2A6CMK2_PRIPA|nr:hypothetical protein PRIPAC_79397 [Pristionchus pacificus]|eukprot:PDM79251.1 hypothetical protein PRIPAC_31830 [Pristionchus pacificus]
MRSSILLVVVIAALATWANAVKMSPEMEKCAEQLLRILAQETNASYKDGITKIMKHIQNGHLDEAQKVVRAFSDADREAAISKYMVGECIPMKSCLDCPIEL